MRVNAVTEPVRAGTADQLARLAHLRTLAFRHDGTPGPDVAEIDGIVRWVLGDVGPLYESATRVWESVRDECERLFDLITDDWDDRDLDGPDGVDEDIRHERTVNRLTGDIEHTIWLARYDAAQARHLRYAYERPRPAARLVVPQRGVCMIPDCGCTGEAHR